MPRAKKRRTGETDTSVITIDRETGEIITVKKVNGKSRIIRIENEKGVEVMPAYSSGTGIDIHKSFGQLTVMVRNQGSVLEFRTAFNTDTESIVAAKEWTIDIIENYSDPKVTVDPDELRYTIESTGDYMTPVLLLWGGKPTVINPNIAKAGSRKSDIIDSRTLCLSSLMGTWPQSFVIPQEIQELRILLSERDSCNKLATRCANRIVNRLLKFGYTVSRDGSVVKKKEVRKFVEDQFSETPLIKPLSEKIGIPDDVKCVFNDLYKDYDDYKKRVIDYDKRILSKVHSMEWETQNGKVSGERIMKVLTSAPGIGPQAAFTWLAYVITPLRFETANKCAAYCGFDPSNRVSAGKVSSTAKRKGQKYVHTLLCQSAHILIRNKSEPFGHWGYQLKCQGSEKKARSALARRLCIALYYMQLKNEEFKYDMYAIAKEPDVIDISIEELCELNPDFRRYMKPLISNGITTTKQMAHEFYIGNLNNVHGLGAKAYTLIRDFTGNQKRYQKLDREKENAKKTNK